MNIERRYSGGFNVYRPTRSGNLKLIDTVFWTDGTKDEVRCSLINHDGYASDIVVVPDASAFCH